MMHPYLWFALVGWAAGWVTGRAIKGTNTGAWGDVLLGIIGGAAGGYLMRHTGTHTNWGFPVSILVVAACAVLFTWLVRRVIQHQSWQLDDQRRKQTQHRHA